MRDKKSTYSYSGSVKKLKGHVEFELIDAQSGKTVEKAEKDNLVTIAPDIICNSFIGGSSSAPNQILPPAEKVLGGLMLFSDNLTEDRNNIQFPVKQTIQIDEEETRTSYPHLVGYAGRDENLSNLLRGSLVTSEGQTGAIPGGYRSVWEFGTTQGNGQIKAAALTYTGALAFKATHSISGYHTIKKANEQVGGTPLCYDKTTQTVYFADGITRTQSGGVSTYTIPIYSEYLPVSQYKVADSRNANGTAAPYKTITVTGFPPNSTPTLYFSDGCDGYLYAVATVPIYDEETQTYVTTSEIRVAKIKVSNLSFDVEIYTRYFGSAELSNRSIGTQNVVCSDGVFYAAGLEGRLYKGVENGSDYLTATTVDLGSGFTVANTAGFNIFSEYMTALHGGGLKTLVTDGIETYFAYVYPDGTAIIDGEPYSTSNTWNKKQFQSDVLMSWWQGDGSPCGNYLGTIANLPSAIVKSSSQTLRVTYTLTDVDPEEEEEEETEE